jgi:hypothetical protein
MRKYEAKVTTPQYATTTIKSDMPFTGLSIKSGKIKKIPVHTEQINTKNKILLVNFLNICL